MKGRMSTGSDYRSNKALYEMKPPLRMVLRICKRRKNINASALSSRSHSVVYAERAQFAGGRNGLTAPVR